MSRRIGFPGYPQLASGKIWTGSAQHMASVAKRNQVSGNISVLFSAFWPTVWLPIFDSHPEQQIGVIFQRFILTIRLSKVESRSRQRFWLHPLAVYGPGIEMGSNTRQKNPSLRHSNTVTLLAVWRCPTLSFVAQHHIGVSPVSELQMGLDKKNGASSQPPWHTGWTSLVTLRHTVVQSLYVPDSPNRSEASEWIWRKTSDPLAKTHDSMCHRVPSADRGKWQSQFSSNGRPCSIRHRKANLGDEISWFKVSVAALFDPIYVKGISSWKCRKIKGPMSGCNRTKAPVPSLKAEDCVLFWTPNFHRHTLTYCDGSDPSPLPGLTPGYAAFLASRGRISATLSRRPAMMCFTTY